MITALLLLAQVQNPCQPCHPQIVASYAKTAMARTSAKSSSILRPAKPFLEPVTQTTFSVSPTLELQFNKQDALEGKRQLDWVIGSGRVGHSLLFTQGNRLFQAPLSYYTEAATWQLSPGFQRRPQLDLTRVVEPGCLNCHTSSFNPATLAIEPGISCERCHGHSPQHIATAGKVAALNPKKLPAHERDSVCAQCHLTGSARVAKFRPSGDNYQPGKKLSDYSAIFVGGKAEASSTIGVTSHYENLALSRCKIASGDKLSCTTCHDPHSEPNNASAFFNAKCQSCHQEKPCKSAPKGDCIQCHMPKAAGRGVDHSSYTNHAIPRLPNEAKPATSSTLTSFWQNETNPRDLALAYAVTGNPNEARPLLEAASKANPRDIQVLSQLAQIHDREGREDLARPLYESILKLDPNNSTACTNLAVILVKAGNANEAILLWRKALKANPAQTGVRMNLAQALFRQGNRAAAIVEIEEALKFDPDQPAARRLLNQIKP